MDNITISLMDSIARLKEQKAHIEEEIARKEKELEERKGQLKSYNDSIAFLEEYRKLLFGEKGE